MPRREICGKFDEIVAFAELERFIDTPVKRYSSGMYMRLAFAVAAHLDTDTLLVDEVLAVGDVGFQKKCLGKMGEVRSQGRTVLFVSHNLGAIRSLCRRAALLDGGRVAADGEPGQVIATYLARWNDNSDGHVSQLRWGDATEFPWEGEHLGLRALRLMDSAGRPKSVFDCSEPIRIEIEYEIKKAFSGGRLSLWIYSRDGELAFLSTDHNMRAIVTTPGFYRNSCVIPGGLLNRTGYILAIDSDIPPDRELLERREYLHFTVMGTGNHGSTVSESWPGIVCPRLEWHVESVPTPSRRPACDYIPSSACR